MKRCRNSLFIIFINSLIGFGGDLIGGVELNYKLLFQALWDAYRNSNIQKMEAKLKPAFGWFVLIIIYIIVTELFFT
jgi:hypothetical protein